jgi:hypothetical protein
VISNVELLLYNTVMAISIRTSNFGWACPNRVFSQAVFQKFVAGHPKFAVKRSARLTLGFALIVSRLGAPRVKKNHSFNNNNKKVGAGWRQGFRWYERAGERLKDWWAGLQCERASLQPPADELAQ